MTQAQDKTIHDMRDTVQTNTEKLYNLDREVVLVKALLVTLMGSGDGSAGMVPRMEKEMRELRGDVGTLKSDIRDIRGDVDTIKEDLKVIRTSQMGANSFMDGWRGVAIAIGLVGALMTMIGTMVAALVWLYQHGGH